MIEDEEFQPLAGEIEPFNIPAVYRNYPGRPWNPVLGTSTNPPMVPPVATTPPIVVGATGAPPPANPPFPPGFRPPILPPTTGPTGPTGGFL